MKIFIDGHDYQYEMESLVRMFFHGKSLPVQQGVPDVENDYIYTKAIRHANSTELMVTVKLGGELKNANDTVQNDLQEYNAECERVFAVMLYRILTPMTGIQLKWGVLTGIRPVKFVHRFHEQGLSDEEIRRILTEKYLVSQQKINLMMETARREAQVLRLSKPNSYSLYISIPFCPTRCLYCSFVSHSIEKTKKLMPEYVELLIREIEYTAEVLRSIDGLQLETIYFGGGTPTSLTAEQLRQVMDAVNRCFDCSSVREYTVEAGRPDTITEEKLCVLKEYGATRISINPQTMNDSVLNAIGRKHTTQQTIDAFWLARKTGHTNINMDLIAGLPTDTVESFRSTLDEVIKLNPENITLHTLSVKRAATLADEAEEVYRAQSATVTQMLEYASQSFHAAAYHPYYLYRQKNTVDNMENVGYCKEGCEGLYNVYIMDETHSIVALGAGAVSKLKEPNGELINRVFNYKYPYEYISRFDEILARKNKIAEFYATHPFECK
ncbi:oxygen-independent coproporphyrinogen-3 oxidase [Hydrogenoanaerobacterium saccharovorans]|uniref:Oxygen-independent coproporphyrinogen-3 oxidase n=1 Tax=Hydrogenoanaerobacterium saccharovorans TaxID=474960 RepID=A0A1H7ZYR6_9FIRM|nr:coproporphyrinogen dehydrogenase HemZ [Hydrogenoanaerobacterium saccharovorans]RPF48334.1 oxygen-independent coproporphyrinogen-3 oxidase [Hydrogenoanaerobacterium saccharovorans]SEM62718.1 oxygen-independent coproporphyrinogen-3 oxidase [Hydrogenoanaerobacterium saccharovorans]